MIVMKISVIVVASLACVIAIYGKSVYALFQICSDVVYVVLFPQLALAVHAPNYINIYGSVAAYFVSLVVRTLGGEKILGLPVIIKFPWYLEEEERQLFPFRTLAMILGLVSLLSFSWLARILKEDISCKKSNDPLIEMRTWRCIDNPAMSEANHPEPPPYDTVVKRSSEKKK
ncbi:UNVERIFIED_CONTAM: hypothetical protein GTU68_066653 [Idotea baltica]|nr:hypothetical protein [Idotea baltica]